MKTISNLLVLGIILFVFSDGTVNSSAYSVLYNKQVELLKAQQIQLYKIISNNKLSDSNSLFQIRKEINRCRTKLKAADFWLRYLEPVLYKKINGPLPVEWETEVFEKYELPYKREGAGLSLAWQYLNGEDLKKDSLLKLISESMNATDAYKADSNTIQLKTHHAFFLCNRLYLLNLASIYTTGFECPDQQQIIPELRQMLAAVEEIYTAYNSSFPNYPLTKNYSDLFQNTIDFVQRQPADFTNFDHFTFLKNYVNPLFALNQQFISAYSVISRSNMDYSLNNTTTSIFDKSLFFAQYPKGVYYRINNPVLLKQIDSIGKLLFYDPVLSVNNQRSCASCHKPTQFFTDTTAATAIQLNKTDPLTRNTPTLLNTVYNHLIHLDGKHLSLQEQAIGVITNSIEMGSEKEEVLKKILSCGGYKKTFQDLLKHLPGETEITMQQVASAITWYYSKFSTYYSPFDKAFLDQTALPAEVISGFNVFMSKGQCATCHFVPTFSGLKPPFTNNEFEVIGVPEDKTFSQLSNDRGRSDIHDVPQMLHAFRTGSLRNNNRTKPYMHNGVFQSLDEVLDFYDAGGGLGKKIPLANQTLSADSLHLSSTEKKHLLAFLESLTEQIKFEDPPKQLPVSNNKKLNYRKVGGEY